MNRITDFTGADRYRSQFFYSVLEQFGTGRDFDDLAECVTTTLRLQADHKKKAVPAPLPARLALS
ncbi:MAG: hypothetical protein HY525_06915 [Betaproteobacteria bacterium]|nr:hypothetical protein [Betaproteobacteria bacterium]